MRLNLQAKLILLCGFLTLITSVCLSAVYLNLSKKRNYAESQARLQIAYDIIIDDLETRSRAAAASLTRFILEDTTLGWLLSAYNPDRSLISTPSFIITYVVRGVRVIQKFGENASMDRLMLYGSDRRLIALFDRSTGEAAAGVFTRSGTGKDTFFPITDPDQIFTLMTRVEPFPDRPLPQGVDPALAVPLPTRVLTTLFRKDTDLGLRFTIPLMDGKQPAGVLVAESLIRQEDTEHYAGLSRTQIDMFAGEILSIGTFGRKIPLQTGPPETALDIGSIGATIECMPVVSISHNNRAYYQKQCLIHSSQGLVGAFMIYLSKEPEIQKARQAAAAVLLTAAGVLLCTFILAIALSRRTIRAIRHLTDSSTAMAEGDLERGIDTRGSDELGVLARSFAQMRDAILIRMEDLRASEERFRDFVEGTDNLITRVDALGSFIYVNHVCERIFGKAPEDCIGESPFSFIDPRDRERTREWFDRCVSKRITSASIENRQVSKTGVVSDMIWTVNFHYDSRGDFEYANSIGRDITDQKKLETRLQQAQKMEAIGTLSGGIAHDFNNILFPLLGYAEILKDDLPQGSPLQAHVDQILTAALRARDLVSQILTFSRQGSSEKHPVRLQSILKEAVRLLDASIPKTIEIRMEMAKEDCVVMADATQIHQVIMNLATNAYHAMEPGGGRLRLVLDRIFVEPDLTGFSDLQPGDYARLRVMDTGKGIPAEIMGNIFDPYFTTKAQNKGTGLGLSMVQGIVKSCRGQVHIYSEPEKGTEVRVYLPLIEQTRGPGGRAAQEPVPGGTERILLVDDEKAIIEMEARVLTRLGYQVTAVNGSAEALACFSQAPDQYDLLLSDMTMPDMTGLELASRIRKIRPDLPVIICTGFSDQINEKSSRRFNIQGYVVKPVTTRQLADAIRSVLDKMS